MDDFTLVGARPQAAPPQHAKEPWHKDLPIVSILLLALIVLGCLLCDVFLTKDPGYMDLSHCSANSGSLTLRPLGNSLISLFLVGP